MADTEMTLEDLPKLKVADLKKALKDRGLPLSGTKPELLTRLQEALQLQETEDHGADEGDISDSEQDINLEDTLVEDTEEPSKEEKELTEPAIKKIAFSADDSDKPKVVEKIVIDKGLTEEERLKKRGEKFGVQSEEARKKIRAERFGITSTDTGSKGGGKIANTPVLSGDLDKLKQRAERFGTVVSNQLSKLEEDAKIMKRKERFGTVLTSTTNNTSDKVKINNTSTPSSTEEIERKKKRAERFGLT